MSLKVGAVFKTAAELLSKDKKFKKKQQHRNKVHSLYIHF